MCTKYPSHSTACRISVKAHEDETDEMSNIHLDVCIQQVKKRKKEKGKFRFVCVHVCVLCTITAVPLSRSRPPKPTMSHRVSPTNGCTALCQQLNQTWTNYCFSTVYTHTQTDTFDCWTVELFGLFQLYTYAYTSTLVGEYRPAHHCTQGLKKGMKTGHRVHPNGWRKKWQWEEEGRKKKRETINILTGGHCWAFWY
jgi:hypothetical protein